jgi:hypothetical protein
MRTKTLVLSGVVAALTSASVLAQVYSLNSVGYVNVTIPTGYSIVSDQLYANGQGVAQYVSPLLDTQVLNGNESGLTFYKYNATSGAYFEFGVNAADTAWAADPANPTVSGASETTLNPGEAVFVYNPNAAFTLTFVGTVPQGTLTVSMPKGFNLVSSVVPQTGALDSALGLTPRSGDTLYYFDPSVGSYGEVGWNGTVWNTLTANTLTPPVGSSQAPTAPIGGGFFYLVTGTGTEAWTRTFTVN